MPTVAIPADPPPTFKVEGSPGDAEAMATRLSRAANAVEGQQDFASGGVISGVGDGGGTWSGKAASAYRGAIAPFASETSTAYTGLTRGVKPIRAYADDLEDLKKTRQQLEHRRGELTRAISSFTDEVRSWEGKEVPPATLADLQARSGDLERQVHAFTTDNETLRTKSETNERTFVGALGAVAGTAAAGRSLSASGYNPADLVRSGLSKIYQGAHPEDIDSMNPTQRAQWWSSLTPAEKEAAFQEFPEYLGNGNGFPASVRNEANQQNLDRDIAQSTAATTVPNTSGVYGDAKRRLDKAQGVRSALDAAERNHPGVPIQLYGYDSDAFGGDGKAIVSVGDLDNAHDVAWNVPGMTTNISSIGGNVDSAGRLYNEATSVEGGSTSMASVAWIGYDAPSDSDMGAVAAPGAAKDGGNFLAADIAGFTASRDQAQLGQGAGAADHLNLNVVGHSYGTTTVGWAGDNGRLAGQVDTVTLLGSPGTGGVTSADEFGIGAKNVYVGSAANDLVGHLGSPSSDETFGLGGLGSDPATTRYGAERFQAEGGSSSFPIGNHNSYYQKGTESLANLGRIVTGHGDDITHEDRRSLWDVISGQALTIDNSVK